MRASRQRLLREAPLSRPATVPPCDGTGSCNPPVSPPIRRSLGPIPAAKRVVFFFSSNGTIHESWLPKMVKGKLELSPILSPLEKFKSKLLVVDGLSHKVIIEKSVRDGHTAGMNTALTGRVNVIPDPGRPLNSLATGISVDQFLAEKMGVRTKLRSIECGVQVEPYNAEFSALSYLGARRPMLPESNPHRVFDRLFKGFTEVSSNNEADEAAAREALADRQRIFGVVTRDLEAVRGHLPQSDRIKMEAHISAVRGIEHSLTTGVGAASGNTCRKPDLGPKIDPWRNDNIPALAKLQMDLLVMALACDLTRIGTLQFGRGGAPHKFSWLGREFDNDPAVSPFCTAKGFHAIAHRENDPVSRAKLVRIHTWYAEQLAYFLDKLAAIPEAGGSMLDNTVVVWLNELGTGGSHSHEQTPWVIAGNAGGFFKTGQVVSFPGQPHNRLLITLCHAMGVETDTFGDPDYCKAGALTGVTALRRMRDSTAVSHGTTRSRQIACTTIHYRRKGFENILGRTCS